MFQPYRPNSDWNVFRSPSISPDPYAHQEFGGVADSPEIPFIVENLENIALGLADPEQVSVEETRAEDGLTFSLKPSSRRGIIGAIGTTSYFIAYASLTAVVSQHVGDAVGQTAATLIQVLKTAHDNKELLGAIRPFLQAYARAKR